MIARLFFSWPHRFFSFPQRTATTGLFHFFAFQPADVSLSVIWIFFGVDSLSFPRTDGHPQSGSGVFSGEVGLNSCFFPPWNPHPNPIPV